MPTNTPAPTPTPIPIAVDLYIPLGTDGFNAPETAAVGEKVRHMAVIRNAGPNASSGSTVTFALHERVHYIEPTAPYHPCSPNYLAGHVTCEVGPLPVGGVETVGVVVRAAAGGTFPPSPSVNVMGRESDPNMDNNGRSGTTTYSFVANLSLPSADLVMPDTMAVGQEVSITATARNHGPGSSRGARVHFVLPEGLAYRRSASGHACTYDPATRFVDCRMDWSNPGELEHITIVGLVNVIGSIRVDASIHPDDADPDLINNAGLVTATSTGPSCPARGSVPVAIRVLNSGDGRLHATIEGSHLVAGNRVQRIHFQQATNALIELPGQPPRPSGFTYENANRQTPLSFFVHRATPGSAATVRLLVIDDCGQWPTFVGGGPTAF